MHLEKSSRHVGAGVGRKSSEVLACFAEVDVDQVRGDQSNLNPTPITLSSDSPRLFAPNNRPHTHRTGQSAHTDSRTPVHSAATLCLSRRPGSAAPAGGGRVSCFASAWRGLQQRGGRK
eukprot:103045-Rhodomonas_salina.4